MDLKGMEYFSALMECRSFTQAAQKLYVSQPAFSRKIAELERETGCQLIDRTVRPLELTEAGIIFARCVRRVLEDVEELEKNMEQIRRGSVSRFVIGYNGKTQQEWVTAARITEYPDGFDLVFAWKKDRFSPSLKYFCRAFFAQTETV